MSVPWLYDAVTLRHFGAIRRLDVIADKCKYIDPPRWTQEVAGEIRVAADIGQPGCRDILAAAWLSKPIAPENSDLRGIYIIQVGLNDGRRPPQAHAGEAEGIYFAEKLSGCFVTDDNGAYDFAVRRLGAARVRDTVDLLREAVAFGDVDSSQALSIATAIRASNRDLRRIHPNALDAKYFDE